ncbi:unnamed protein product [Lupinus luteus]|uniref:Transcription repressor n=1 Tax=Lupinus luteus TaxID=3873 RepID=A0AAV1WLW3_LUPLU
MALRKGRRGRNKWKQLIPCFSNLKQALSDEYGAMSTSSKPCSSIQHNNGPSSTMILYGNQHDPFQYSYFQPEPEPEPESADIAKAFASERFFFSSPGSSNSIVESATAVFFNDSVAVAIYSVDPYLDFRQSMEEMVEVMSNWEELEELLLCYLALNWFHVSTNGGVHIHP